MSGGEGEREEGGELLQIQRAGTMTAPSAVVSLQRPPPPLIFSVRTEEERGNGGVEEGGRKKDGARGEVVHPLTMMRLKKKKKKKKKTKNKKQRPFPFCARRVTWGPFHSEISISREGERFIRSHSSKGLRCLEEPQG